MPPNPQEVIDLTGSSPEVIVIESDDDPEPPTPQNGTRADTRTTTTTEGKKRRKPRKKRRVAMNPDAEEGELIEEMEAGGTAAGSSVPLPRSQPVEGERRNTRSGGRSHHEENSGRNARNLLDRIEGGSSNHATMPEDDRPNPERETRRRRRSRERRERAEREREEGSDPRNGDRERRNDEGHRRSERYDGRRDDEERKKHKIPLPRSRAPRSPDNRQIERDDPPLAPNDTSQLFFVDVKPADIPVSVKPTVPSPIPSSSGQPNGVPAAPDLLLPSHVQVINEGTAPIEIIPPPPVDSDSDDYIDYLQYDDDRAPGVMRYFDDIPDEFEVKASKAPRFVCKNCGAEGEHKTYECPVLICLTCGARDEHSTRSCPISKTCFSCGMKGHINKTCPNRHSNRGAAGVYDDCDRCGSDRHKSNECPTLWRLYEYVDDAQRQEILRHREEKRTLKIGAGGEGYIALDEWCYNCGGCGHLGDDCMEIPHPHDFPREPSAFSAYNTLSGPFFDAIRADKPKQPPSSSKKARKREWEREDGLWADGHGFVAPVDVGRQGKRKERERLETRAREMQQHEDEDDWFAGMDGRAGAGDAGSRSGGRRNSNKDSGGGSGGGGKGPPKGGKITFGDLAKDRDRFGGGRRDSGGRGDGSGRSLLPYDDDLAGPSRERDNIQIRGASRRHGSGRYDHDRGRDDRDRDRDRGRDRDRDRGPRYRGGYGR